MGGQSEKTFKTAFKRLVGFRKRGYALDVVSKPYRIRYVYDTETKSILAEAFGNESLPEGKQLDDAAIEALTAKGYAPCDGGNFLKLHEIDSKTIDEAYVDFVAVFTDVFRVATEHGVAYELSTTEPTPAISRLLNLALEVQKEAFRLKFDPLAREGIYVPKPATGAKKGCFVLLAASMGFAVAAAAAAHLLAAGP
jgi:hypothetical protein